MDINHLFAKQDCLEFVGEQGFRGGFLLIEDGSSPCGHMGQASVSLCSQE